MFKKFGYSILFSLMLIILGLIFIVNPLISEQGLIYLLAFMCIIYGVEILVNFLKSYEDNECSFFDILLSILFIFSGFYVIFNMDIAMDTIPACYGILLIAGAIVKIPYFIKYRNVSMVPTWIFVINIIASVILGILLITNTLLTILTLTMFIGVFILISGIIDLIGIIYLYIKTK